MNRTFDDESKLEFSSSFTELAQPQNTQTELKVASALREVLKEGYDLKKLKADILAGIVVGIVALPLAMALAIACGVPPQYGIYTVVTSAALICLLGGSRTQVSGPTAAFVVILAPIAAKYGIGGLVLASLLAGIILVFFGVARLGKFIEYIPTTVTTGFTAGIGVVIAVLQLKDFLGLTVKSMPEHFPERVLALVTALPTLRVADLSIGVVTLGILLLWPKINKSIPSPLVALAFAGFIAFILKEYVPGFDVATIGSRFSYNVGGVTHAGIPRALPMPILPWSLPGANGQAVGLSLGLIRELLPSAFAIAMLGAIESLLSAVVSDGMANTKHDPDAELFAQGVGNIVGPFFGGFAATGAIARTATNIRSGGRSPVAAFTHSIFVLLAVLLLAPLVAYLPMASLAALLLLVAWNMSEAKHFIHITKIAPRSDVLVLLMCFSLTVLFDMVIGVSVGLVLSSLLFMHWMAVTSKVNVFAEKDPKLKEPLPPNTMLYEIAGPLFFGAAQKAMSTFNAIGQNTKVVILYIGSVPLIDATGVVSLESVLTLLKKKGVFVIISGVRRQPGTALARAGIKSEVNSLFICRKFSKALEHAWAYTNDTIEVKAKSPSKKAEVDRSFV